MTTANQIPVGSVFVGSVWREDLFSHPNKRRFPGEDISVHLLLACHTEDGAREVMKMMASLPSDSGMQISCDEALWVCGIREKRSKYIRIVDWTPRVRTRRIPQEAA